MKLVWTAIVFFGVAMLITALGYLFNPYYDFLAISLNHGVLVFIQIS